MNVRVDDGFVVLGGPLGEGEKILLIIAAQSEQESLPDSPTIPGPLWDCCARPRSSTGRSCLAKTGERATSRILETA
jgi:hypothetical protein